MHVRIPLPIGFLLKIDNWIKPLVIAEEIKLKFGVLPLIIEPIAINPSNLFVFQY
mgnify:CR=1 FL=1